MAIKTNKMVRHIRDEHYKETKNMTPEHQIAITKEQSKKLQADIKKLYPKGDSKKAVVKETRVKK